jgi:hypothetical protein
MYSVRIGYEGYEVMLVFRDEKSARAEYELANKGWQNGDTGFVLKDGFKRQVTVDFKPAIAVTFTDEEAAAMARAELQLHEARASLNAQKRLQQELPSRGIQLPGMRQ